MKESIRILILEDNPTDADLIQFELQEAGLTFTPRVVATKEGYVQALEESCPDLILSDYDLPRYNGALALAEAKRRCPGVPFILVTGAVPEDRAIDILTEGARDYVLKTRLEQRLVPAVRRALAEAAERCARERAEADLREAYAAVEQKVRVRTAELEDERRRLQSIIEGTRVGTWEWNVQTGDVVINETLSGIVGYAVSELAPVTIATWERLAHPEDLKRSNALLERHFAGELPYYDCECRIRHKDGRWVWIHDRGCVVTRTEDGKPLMMFGTHLDITERKRVEEEMVVVAEIGRIVTSTLDIDEIYEAFALQVGKVLPFDRIVIKIIGPGAKTSRNVYIAGEGLDDRNMQDIYPIEGSVHAEMLRTKSTVLIQTEDFGEYEERFPRLLSTFQAGFKSMLHVPLFAKGQIIGTLMLRSRSCPAYSEADVRLAERIGTQIAGAIANAQLYGNLSEMEKELRETTGRLHLATVSAKAGVWDWNLQTGEMIWDERMLELYGMSREDLSEGILALEKRLHPDDAARVIGECRAALRGERDFDTEYRIRRPDGTAVHIRANGIVLRNEAGAPLRMIGLNIDITERNLSLEALQDSEEKHRRIVEAMSDAVLLCAKDTIIYANPAALKLFRAGDQQELLGRCYPELVHPEDRALSSERLAKSMEENWTAPSREHRVLTLDGQPVPVESGAVPIKYRGETQVFVVFHDISLRLRAEEEKARLQEQLLQSQKMESVGRLAGGVAHDFNNMLGVILGHAEMAMDGVDPGQPLHADLEEIRKAAGRSADLTRQLLAFARKQVVSPKILDLNETVAGTLKMLRRLIGEDIRLVWLPGANLWPVKVDPSQIDQILANLSVNARDAIVGVGNITIETQNVQFDAAHCANHAGCTPGTT